MSYCLDTCAFLIYTGLSHARTLGKEAAKILASTEVTVSVSPLIAVELDYLQLKGRLSFPHYSACDLLLHAAEAENWNIQSLDMDCVKAVSALLRSGIKDPFDLLIAATSLRDGMTLITCDHRLKACKLLKTVW